MASSYKYYPITGIRDGLGSNGQTPLRMDIDTWWLSTDALHMNQKTLFIEALNRLEARDPIVRDPETQRWIPNRLSYFQIAGIHGQPHVPWDNPNGSKDGSYCVHGEALFATWHRPYLALLEQALYDVMKDEIIPSFRPESERPALYDAAAQWRFPYWDWAAKKQQSPGRFDYNVPILLRLEEVSIRTQPTPVRNPLYVFRTPRNRAMTDERAWGESAVQDQNFEGTIGTSRHPPANSIQSQEWINGYQDHDAITRELRDTAFQGGGNLTGSLREGFFRVLTGLNTFETFATGDRREAPNVRSWHSCEGLHNNMHNYCGGETTYGHMNFQSVAAFDPIFWLHHCNVDRMIDLWQGLHPGVWLTSSGQARAALVPFRKNAAGEYHDSNTVRNTQTLGYSYPETQRWLPKYRTNGQFDPQKLRVELATVLRQAYGSTGRAEFKAMQTVTKPDSEAVPITDPQALTSVPAPKIQAQINGEMFKGASISALSLDSGAEEPLPEKLEVEDYVADIQYERFALGGKPFNVRIFIGPVPETGPYTYENTVSQVGNVYNFVSPLPTAAQSNEGGCKNCDSQAEQNKLVTGQVVLTNALLTRHKQKVLHPNEAGENELLESMRPEDVSPFLKANMHWRVTTLDSQVVNKAEVGGLKIAVAVAKAEHFADPTKLPIYHDYKVLYDVTADATSGTGAKLEDDLFPSNDAYDGTL